MRCQCAGALDSRACRCSACLLHALPSGIAHSAGQFMLWRCGLAVWFTQPRGGYRIVACNGREWSMKAHLASLAAITLCTTPAFAISNSDLRAALEQRFKGDRTGACVAAAVIDGGTIASACFCANPNSQRAYDDHTAFEIGSVTKTMTAALLAEFMARGEVKLNDPLAKLLPAGTTVPSSNGR